MKLEKWASIAEISAAVAVVATLLVLLLEMRDGNELTRIANYQEIVRQYNDLRIAAINNPDLLAAYYDTVDGSYPDRAAPEGQKLNLWIISNFNVYNVAYFSWQAGIIGENDWVRLTRTICDISQSMPNEYREDVYFRLTDDLVSYLESTC